MDSVSVSLREAFGEKLVKIGEKNDKVIVLDADVGASTRSSYFRERFPKRFLNVGISEQDMMGIAAGLAIEGFIPVATGFAMFLLRAWEQIRNTISRDNLNVKIVATHAGLSDYADGSSHQCLEDIALMRILPNMNVLVPSDSVSVRSLLEQIIVLKGPCYMRIGRDYSPKVYTAEEDVIFGKPNILEEGDDVTIVACGIMVHFALETRRILLEDNIRAQVVDLHTIKPLNKDLLRYCERTDKVVTFEEHNVLGGMGSAVCELLSEKGFKIKRFGIMDIFGESSRDYIGLLQKFELDENSLAKRVKSFVEGDSIES
ncbi:MAG: transketolase family protein [Nitrososphaeria archaeon]|nr:transketolase family protein [Nitrososphaeria archaeon]